MTTLHKTLLLTGGLSAMVLVGVLAHSSVQARRVRENTAAALRGTPAAWEAYQTNLRSSLAGGVRVLANDPALKALVEEYADDFETISDTVLERTADTGADLLFVVSPHGKLIGGSQWEGSAEGLTQSPLVQLPVSRHLGTSGFWRRPEGWFLAVSEPMLTGGELKGVLVAGLAVAANQARQMSQINRSEIAFVNHPANGPWSVGPSTLGARETALLAGLRSRPAERTTDVFELELDGEPWLAVETPVRDASGESLGSLLALRDARGSLAVRSKAVLDLASNTKTDDGEERD